MMMNKPTNTNTTWVLIALALLISLSGCNATALAQGEESSRSTAARLMGSELAGAVSEQDYVTLLNYSESDEAYFRHALAYLEEKSDSLRIRPEQMTAGELRRMGFLGLEGGFTYWFDPVERMMAYRKQHGQLPANGLQLYPELTTHLGAASASQLSEQELLLRYPAAIDPITGRFYTSFTSHEWAPASLLVEVVDDPAKIKEMFPRRRVMNSTDPEDGYKLPSEAWHLVIYGEREGSILYDGWSWR